MDFFSVTASDSGLLPNLIKPDIPGSMLQLQAQSPLRCLDGGVISPRNPLSKRAAGYQRSRNYDAEETGMPNVSEQIQCREHAQQILDKANSESEELFGKQQSGEEDEEEDNDAKAALIEYRFQLMEMTICASHAIETSEDVDRIIAKRGLLL